MLTETHPPTGPVLHFECLRVCLCVLSACLCVCMSACRTGAPSPSAPVAGRCFAPPPRGAKVNCQ